MKTLRLVARVGAVALVAAAVGLAVAVTTGAVEEATLATLFSGRLGSTTVFVVGVLLMFAIVVGGGAWAYRRTAGPVPSDEVEVADEDDPAFEFGGYENFEAFVEAGGLDEYRDEDGDPVGSQVLRSPVDRESDAPSLEDLDPEIRRALEERAAGRADDRSAETGLTDRPDGGAGEGGDASPDPVQNRERRDAGHPTNGDPDDGNGTGGMNTDDRTDERGTNEGPVTFEPFDGSDLGGNGNGFQNGHGNGHDAGDGIDGEGSETGDDR